MLQSSVRYFVKGNNFPGYFNKKKMFYLLFQKPIPLKVFHLRLISKGENWNVILLSIYYVIDKGNAGNADGYVLWSLQWYITLNEN